MALINCVRTTAFRLTPEHFGRVFVYRPGPTFCRTWAQLEGQWRRGGDTAGLSRLPYGGLATALRVLTGDFVALQRRVEGKNAFMISRRPISHDELEIAVGAWEVHALGLHDGPVTRVLGHLRCEEIDVASQVERRAGLPPTFSEGWAWDVGVWEIAHRLAAAPMETDDGSVRLRLDSDAGLLSWDRLTSPDNLEVAAAMHKIVLHMITVPGVEEPVVSMQSSLVRLAPTWRETRGARYAWAELTPEAPILRARVRNRRIDGGYETLWNDRAAEVLRGASLQPLPATTAEPSLRGVLRTGYAKQPNSHKIGRGVGPWFHECVAHHAAWALGDAAIPLELKTTRSSWPSAARLAPRLPLGFARESEAIALRLLVLYSSSEVRQRVRDALDHVLAGGAGQRDGVEIQKFSTRLRELADGEVLASGKVEVRFVKPPEAAARLLSRSAPADLEAWLHEWLEVEAEEGVATAALVETDESAAHGKDSLADPKPTLRGALGRRGIVTQFISRTSAPSGRGRNRPGTAPKFDDHAAAHAVSDLLRSAGAFLRPFPEFGVQSGTLAVGVYATRVTSKTTQRRTSYLVNLVAASVGGRAAWGFVEGEGWVPIDKATAWFLGTDHQLSWQEAKQRVERAIGQLPLALGSRPVIVLFDALGCRRFWPCLTDKAGAKAEPWMKRNGQAVIRVRAAAAEVPRPAGVGDWDSGLNPAKHTDFRPMTVIGAQGESPTFVLSGSAVMSTGQSARKTTRLSAPDRALREDWHSLGTTELLVLEPGGHEPERLIEQIAMLCRVAPTSDRTLRWPSPLHLARAVVRDHPHGYFADGEAEAEEVEDGRQMRFDL